LGVVLQVRSENLVANTRREHRIADREHHFAALEQVTRHPVRAAAEDLGLAAIGEGEDAAVLQVSADDGSYADALAQSFYSGTQGADAAHNEVDLDARVRRSIQRFDGGAIE